MQSIEVLRNLAFEVVCVTCLVTLVLGAADPRNSPEVTGSRLDSRIPEPAVIPLSEFDEIDKIRILLQEGRGEEAVNAARAHLAYLERLGNQLPRATVHRYFALNALCGALTQTGELEKAIATCTTAIELSPKRWSAVNNRGTAHYVSGNYQAALNDYRRAMELVANNEDLAEMIQHNIELTETKLGYRQ